jgi:hypothetical protein
MRFFLLVLLIILSILNGGCNTSQNANLSSTEKLLQEKVLKDSNGNEALRDIVQLVKYENFKDLGMRELALEVLGEVPD